MMQHERLIDQRFGPFACNMAQALVCQRCRGGFGSAQSTVDSPTTSDMILTRDIKASLWPFVLSFWPYETSFQAALSVWMYLVPLPPSPPPPLHWAMEIRQPSSRTGTGTWSNSPHEMDICHGDGKNLLASVPRHFVAQNRHMNVLFVRRGTGFTSRGCVLGCLIVWASLNH